MNLSSIINRAFLNQKIHDKIVLEPHHLRNVKTSIKDEISQNLFKYNIIND